VIEQARRRVLKGEQVPRAEKVYSIFEPHTDLIKRGKVRTPIEFGHKVFLAESEQGLITQYEVLKGNPSDEAHVVPSLDRHMEAFGRVPELYGSDRGVFSEQNLASCKHDGVKVVCIPQRGGKKTAERGAHLGAIPRSRHEALSRRGKRSLRVVGCCGCGRQQPDENRSIARKAIVSQTKTA
jgi:IS5 family transposase